MVNVHLGTPYEEIVAQLIRTGYASSQVEAIRQALLNYQKYVGELEEHRLVHKAVQKEMEKIRSGKEKTIPASKVFKEAGL